MYVAAPYAALRRTLQALTLLAVMSLMAGCSGDEPQTEASPSSTVDTPSASAAPSGIPSLSPSVAATVPTVSDASAVLAVVLDSGPLELYAVAPRGGNARAIRRLEAPVPQARVLDVSLSSGADPVVCAVWDLEPSEDAIDLATSLICYARGTTAGVEVEVPRASATRLAVRADGRALAWATSAPEGNGRIDVASLDGVRVREVRSYLNDPARPEGTGESSFTGSDVGSLGWLSDAELAVSRANQSDDGSGLTRFPVGPDQKRGWGDPQVIAPEESERPYAVFDGVVSPAQQGAVLAVERVQAFGDSEAVGARAVRVDLLTGRVRDVIAFPREGRGVLSVSGGPGAVLYVTADLREGDDVIVSVRYPGQGRGEPVPGLPNDIAWAVLQP